ncbi:unnamed protein product [Didymodactylos carnosus]|uniref:Expansin-like EG45 domain-containing protein n=1 Tax=Didymodactylos carnosus TaxID=1234261 RepID=A0A815KLL6_9BILA|nr:unnamed protein product [Didymodactylos carnosus]CAF1394674.1 unnamed protein product [Didymodactylos carnosus]CAF3828628.1 unnamed protein product [Didymodactylos carnosus]CAF4288930.1 unnamed protein product [Didymodactylos carnosus]
MINNGGTCSLDPTPSSGKNNIHTTVAMNAQQFYGSEACGLCLEVTGNGEGVGTKSIQGTFNVFVNNLCPECKKGDLDLGLNGDGRWKIEWKAIACNVDGPINYFFQGSNPYYIKVQARNYRHPVSKFAIIQNGVRKYLSRTQDNFFISKGDINFPIYPPFVVELTSMKNEVLTDIISKFENGIAIVGGKQFET